MFEGDVVLITDDLFIESAHVERIEAHGYTVRRDNLSDATPKALSLALHDVDGYILGGTERISNQVLDSADRLRAIVFTGSAYREFILAHEQATAKGIALAATPGANAMAVAEYAIALTLLMTRHVLTLGRTGSASFRRSRSLNELEVGIIGLGHVGRVVAANLRALGVHSLNYNSRRRNYPAEAQLGIHYRPLTDLLGSVDVLVLTASRDDRSPSILHQAELALLRDGAIIVNVAYYDAIEEDALFRELSSQRLRAAYDAPPKRDFSSLPLDIWFASNAQTGFNSDSANMATSEVATEALIDLLGTGLSRWLVNPEYLRYQRPPGIER